MQFLSAYISPKRSLGTKPAVLTLHFPAKKIGFRIDFICCGSATKRPGKNATDGRPET
jgi:hypothetical protein